MKRLPWNLLQKRSAKEPEIETPFWFRSWSNGEKFYPQRKRNAKLRELTIQRSIDNARKLGIDRRDFMTSTMGMATALWTMKLAGCSETDSKPDAMMGDLEEAMLDEAVACDLLCGDEFVFDVQTHHYEQGDWMDTNLPYSLFVGLFGDVDREAYIRRIFLESDTTMAVLSGLPSSTCTEEVMSGCGLPITNRQIADSRDFINSMSGPRLINHAMVMPNTNLELQLQLMEEEHREWGVGGWKVYTPWGPNGVGFFLDDEDTGIPMIEKGLELGVNVFSCHKGLPIPTFDDEHQKSQDIGVVAARYPDAHFVVYHSSISAGTTSSLLGGSTGSPDYGAYEPDAEEPLGVNMLIRGMEDNGVGPNENVYGELGTAYRQALDEGGDVLAHFLGKLMKYVGEDNVLWGSDVMNGPGPQDLIDQFRTFEIPTQLQEDHGYPELTSERRAKILGLNAARVFGIDLEAQRCKIEEEEICQNKQQMQDEFGPRRWVQPPSAPDNVAEYAQRLKQNKGMPG